MVIIGDEPLPLIDQRRVEVAPPFDYGDLAMRPVLNSNASLGARSETRLQSTLEPSGLPLRMPFSEKSETAGNGRNSAVPFGRIH